MPNFFIERPIFAWVIAIVIMLTGMFAVLNLPVEQYPKIAPPSISISTIYPGASAKTLENSVTQVIEQSLTGIDHLRYFSSSSDGSGQMTITLTFEPEADPDIAQVQVQNKVQSVQSLLPREVQNQGVTVRKAAASFLMIAALYSEDGSMGEFDISDYIKSNMAEPLSRVQGVGELMAFGQQHSMRIWLNPESLHSYALMPMDIKNAIQARNTDVAPGQLGGMPALAGQQLNATINAQSKLRTVKDFENILLTVNPDGSQVRLKDVARIELGVQDYSRIGRYNGREASGIAFSLATGANALETGKRIKAKIEELSPFMPPSLKVAYPYDTTPFIKLSIQGVVKTLFEAIGLVFIVMYLFLQNFRATLIPTIAVPVVLLGTFGVLSAFGFTINVLTMFAMVIAIGLLVDDAIVVVENVERVMTEKGLDPKAATKESMQQITGALVGIAMVLSAVFIPMAFFSGSTGAIYRQFSITIVSAMTLSVLVAVILTPALCATLLKPVHAKPRKGFFRWFNAGFESGKTTYLKSITHVVGRPLRFLCIYGAILIVLAILFLRLPTSFLPDEDQGNLMMMVSAPPGATMERTRQSVQKVEDYFLNEAADAVQSIFTLTGFSFAGQGQNVGMGFIELKDWKNRTRSDQHAKAIAQRAMGRLQHIKDATVFAFIPPPIQELGNATGFNFHLIDSSGQGHQVLLNARNQMLQLAAQHPRLSGVRPNGLEDVPQYQLEIDYEKAHALGLPTTAITSTLAAAWGASYVNDFIEKGRVKKVYLQGDAPHRMLPGDIGKWYVRNASGTMVPFSAFTQGHWTYGSPKLERYNGRASMEILGAPGEGVSSGDAMDLIETLAEKLPQGIGLEWTGISHEEKKAGTQTGLLYGVSLVFIFLCLAALYESWSIPFSIMLIVPMGIVGSVIAAVLAGLSNDVYFQIALLTTVGLAAKNAILIVEFAKALHNSGMSAVESVREAAGKRLRPILMTSFAFVLGVTPLAISSGAGSASQNAIGIGVIGGMAGATTLTIVFVPLFFVLIENQSRKKRSA